MDATLRKSDTIGILLQAVGLLMLLVGQYWNYSIGLLGILVSTAGLFFCFTPLGYEVVSKFEGKDNIRNLPEY